MPPLAGAVLRRQGAVRVAFLALLVILAWAWLLAGAGMAMDAHGMMTWSGLRFGLTFSMWWVMMVAMMLPSAAPVILLYDRVARQHGGSATAAFPAGYLVAWGGFSLVATSLQMLLEQAGMISAMTMSLPTRQLSGVVLILAGIYQLSPWKGACLSHCRNPAEFIALHHRSGPFRMGLIHGSWCVGCCWALMALLFVGGVMNLVWIAALAVLVASEKLLPFGRWIPLLSAPILLGWGAIRLLAG